VAEDPVESFAVDEDAEVFSGLVDGPRATGANRTEAMNWILQGFEIRGEASFKADREVLVKVGASGLVAGESDEHPLHTAEEVAGADVEDIWHLGFLGEVNAEAVRGGGAERGLFFVMRLTQGCNRFRCLAREGGTKARDFWHVVLPEGKLTQRWGEAKARREGCSL